MVNVPNSTQDQSQKENADIREFRSVADLRKALLPEAYRQERNAGGGDLIGDDLLAKSETLIQSALAAQ